VPTFQLRGIDPALWSAVKQKAQQQNVTIKQAVLKALEAYVNGNSTH
jgi:hypothetical protein